MRIVALVKKSSDWSYGEIKTFNSYGELFEYMRNTFDCWVVEFEDREELSDFYKAIRFFSHDPDYEKADIPEGDIYIELEIYDDYRE